LFISETQCFEKLNLGSPFFYSRCVVVLNYSIEARSVFKGEKEGGVKMLSLKSQTCFGKKNALYKALILVGVLQRKNVAKSIKTFIINLLQIDVITMHDIYHASHKTKFDCC
jgi:hypothetical protein